MVIAIRLGAAGELISTAPSRDAEPGTEASQDVWELLSRVELKAKDRVIAKVLSVDTDTVTSSLMRSREALLKQGYGNTVEDADG